MKKQKKLTLKEMENLKAFMKENNILKYTHTLKDDFDISLKQYKDYSFFGLVSIILGTVIFSRVIGDPINNWENFKLIMNNFPSLTFFAIIGIIAFCYCIYKISTEIYNNNFDKREIISVIENKSVPRNINYYTNKLEFINPK